MAFVEVAANTLDDAYSIENSLRCNGTDSYLNFTLGTPTSQRIATFSAWGKFNGQRSGSDDNSFWSMGDDAGQAMNIVRTAGTPQIYLDDSDGKNLSFNNGPNLRDSAAWYHFVVQIDTTQSTATNRMKWFINGTQLDNTTASHEVSPDQNYDIPGLASGQTMSISKRASSSSHYIDGYIAEMIYLDGSIAAPTAFGKVNDNGVWIPKKPAGLTFGNNGAWLEFKQTGTSANASGIGADSSGNGNHFTVNNLAAIDVTTDTPTNNFATLNPLHKSTDDVVLSEGNLKMVSGYSSGWQHCAATMAVRNGKWYWEAKALAVAATDKTSIGVFQFDTTDVDFIGVTNTDRSSKGISGHGAGTGSYSYAQGDIIMCGMDLDNNKVYWGKNGTWFGSLDPAAGSGSTTQTIDNANFCVPAVGGYDDSSWELNFGVPQFSISSGNADANGYGNFEYSVPSGFYALCTKNLAEYG